MVAYFVTHSLSLDTLYCHFFNKIPYNSYINVCALCINDVMLMHVTQLATACDSACDWSNRYGKELYSDGSCLVRSPYRFLSNIYCTGSTAARRALR